MSGARKYIGNFLIVSCLGTIAILNVDPLYKY
jgi:hypothetical protein